MKQTAITNLIIVIMLIVISAIASTSSTVSTFGSASLTPVYYGDKSSKNVCIMVNVYWGNEYIPQMLKIFEDNNIKTTFFVGGSWANKNVELLESIHNNGHEIANHGYFHKDGDKLNLNENVEEIEVTHKLIKSLINVDMNLFAPPSGAYNDVTMQACEKLGYKAIMWTYDTIDWRDQDVEKIVSRATKKLEGGNLILMHPTKASVLALPSIINAYTKAGYTLTTVSNCIK